MTIRKCLLTLGVGLALFLIARLPAAYPNALAQTDHYVATLDPVLGLIQHQTAQDDPRDLASWHTLSEPILVSEGDRIRTGSGGLAYLTFFEGVETEIHESTLVVVSTLVLPDDTDQAFDISLDVLVGMVFTSVDAILDNGDRFEIHTPGASAVVRGTRWYTVVTPTGESAFATERGRIQVIRNRLTPPTATAPPVVAAPPTATALPGAAAPPVAAAPPPEAAMSAAAAPNFLSAGAAVLTDPYGTVLDYAENFQLPERPDRATIRKALVAPDCGDGVCKLREHISCPVDCLDQVELPGCGDGTCDIAAGEDLLVCAADCGPWAGDSCGNGTCDPGENGVACPSDCGQEFRPFQPEACGNGTCDPSESALNCPADCR
jgi:hypothetical protein